MNIDNQIRQWAMLVNEDVELFEDDDSKIPLITSHEEFLKICKDRNVEVERKSVDKQGKVVNGRIADKEEKVKSREGEEQVRPGDLVIDDGDNTFYVVAKENIKNFYDVDDNGNSAVDKNNKKWRKIAQKLYYYITPFDVDVKVDWQKEPLHAKQGYALVSNEKQKDYKKGADLSPVAPEKFQDKTLWKGLNETAEVEQKIEEGISDFFGKLFNTKSYQKKLEDAEYEKKHTLVKVAKAYGDNCQFAQAEYANDGYPIDYSTVFDVICFNGEVDKDKLLEAFKTSGYEDVAKDFKVEKVNNQNVLIHNHDSRLTFGSWVKEPIF